MEEPTCIRAHTNDCSLNSSHPTDIAKEHQHVSAYFKGPPVEACKGYHMQGQGGTDTVGVWQWSRVVTGLVICVEVMQLKSVPHAFTSLSLSGK